jgi:membrane-associated phospholipid phosphatase
MHRDAGRGSPGRARRKAAPTSPVTPREQRATTRHGPVAQLLIAWSPLSVILLAYAAAQWVSAPLASGDGAGTNRLGFGLHVAGPADLDRAVFGTVPSVWLQERLVEGTVHWYDAVAALVYVTHYVSLPLLTGVVWFCARDRFRAWIATVLTFTAVGVGGYVVYPAAPPWIASGRGEIGPVDRISALGWDHLHLDVVGSLIARSQEGSNPVAAMPSLHAGAALLVALVLWPGVNALSRAVLLGYAMSMGLTLVYTGEHYVVDLVAGWLTAAAAVAVGAAVHRHRATHRARSRSPAVAPAGAASSATPAAHGGGARWTR